jgi:hypothetical protein
MPTRALVRAIQGLVDAFAKSGYDVDETLKWLRHYQGLYVRALNYR